MKEKEFPVFVIDSGDNPGAGSNQKIVEPLIYLKEHGYKEVLYGSVCDEEAVEKLIKEGVGGNRKKSIIRTEKYRSEFRKSRIYM